MSRFVEISGAISGLPGFVDAERVEGVGVHDQGRTIITTWSGSQMLVGGTPAEVVAKLQQPDRIEVNSEVLVAAPPAESEAVQLLERWMGWWRDENNDESPRVIYEETDALLAKLKGGE